MDKYKIF